MASSRPRTESIAERLRRRLFSRGRYDRLIRVSVSRSRILGNLALFEKAFPGAPMCPVLKANAYGHGLREVAAILASGESMRAGRIPFVVVDSYHEALAARKAFERNGIRRQDILIIGYATVPTIARASDPGVIFTMVSLSHARELAEAASRGDLRQPVRVHLKIDTGMRRQGILPAELEEAVRLLSSSSSISFEGACSHLSEADSADSAFTDKQIAAWNSAVRALQRSFPGEPGKGGLHYHLTATAGADHIEKALVTAARLGLGLYGLAMPTHSLYEKLRPALSMTSVIASLKPLAAGESIGYDRTFTARKPMTIAIIPVGYYEGLDRRLSNRGALVAIGSDGARYACPIVGKVSMDISAIDVTACAGAVSEKSPVVVVSDEPSDPCSVRSMAKLAETIPYETLVYIPSSIHREIVE